MQYTANFSGCKDDNFQLKKIDSFLVFGKKINCGYTLEPRTACGSNEYPHSVSENKNKKKKMYTP